MGALENLLSGIGAIISGFINSILALVEGTFNILSEIIFGVITLITSILSGFVKLGYNLIHFVYSNLAILIFLAAAFFIYTAFFAGQQTQRKRVGTKKRL